MKHFRPFFMLLGTLASCSVLAPSAEEPKLEETHWKLIAVNQKALEPSDQAYLDFSEGSVKGKAACNSFSGEFESKGKKLSMGKLASTKMYCEGLMDQENQIITNLQNVKRYEIRYGLLYLYDSDNLILTYKK